MAGKKVFNDRDSMEINELAALDGDISDAMLEKLQKKVLQETGITVKGLDDDSTLFEEPINESVSQPAETESETLPEEQDVEKNESNKEELPAATEDNKDQSKEKVVKLGAGFDDNFIKKYKAKLNKQASATGTDESESVEKSGAGKTESASTNETEPIDKITNGNITEKIITQEQKEYNDSLDFLDGNVKYSKYVIYIDPQNVDFIEGLTVKDRKNLINAILKQQGDILKTKKRFGVIQAVITHIIVCIITIAISIPIIYHTINASLEASINNYRRSQTNFQTLYKEKGKITNIKN